MEGEAGPGGAGGAAAAGEPGSPGPQRPARRSQNTRWRQRTKGECYSVCINCFLIYLKGFFHMIDYEKQKDTEGLFT